MLEAYNVYVGDTSGGEGVTPANGSNLIFGTTYTATNLQVSDSYFVTVQSFGGGGFSPPSVEATSPAASGPLPPSTLTGPAVSIASIPDGSGYWLADAAGDVSAHGSAVSYGPTTPLAPPPPWWLSLPPRTAWATGR